MVRFRERALRVGTKTLLAGASGLIHNTAGLVGSSYQSPVGMTQIFIINLNINI